MSKKLNKIQLKLIKKIRDGGFKDAWGFIEITKKSDKVGFCMHDLSKTARDFHEIKQMFNVIFWNGIGDLLLIIDGNKILKEDVYLKDMLNNLIEIHNKDNRKCSIYQEYLKRKKIPG